MNVLRRRESRNRTVGTASRYYGNLTSKINPSFENRLASKIWRVIGIGRGPDFLFPFAILTKISGLQNRRITHFFQCKLYFFFISNDPVQRNRKTISAKKGFFALPVLANIKDFRS